MKPAKSIFLFLVVRIYFFALRKQPICHRRKKLFYYKIWQKFITKCIGFLLQNATFLLQNATVITKCNNFITTCDVYYRMRWYNCALLDCVLWNHGTIIRKGITCKKKSCYMRDSACRWFIVKKTKIFQSYVRHFWILAGVRKCRNLIGLCKQAFLNCPTIFLECHNKTKLLPASFSCFQDY